MAVSSGAKMAVQLAMCLLLGTTLPAAAARVHRRSLHQEDQAPSPMSNNATNTSSSIDPLTFVQPLTAWTGFDVIFRTGDDTPTSTLPVGTLIDINGRPLAYRSSDGENASNPWNYDISVNPDFSSIQVTPGGNVYSITQFEGANPATAYVAKLNQGQDGTLTPEWFKPTNWSEWGGLWTPCAGSVTPWGTHGGGEEYEPDAFCIHTATDMDTLEACLGGIGDIADMLRYTMPDTMNLSFTDIQENFNPYLYGHAFEVALINEEGDTSVGKHYTMGRHSYEMWLAMPDNKTVYATDDGTATSFWRFVADTPGDMSAGTLYGAKFNQENALYGGSFQISWIELGHGTQEEIAALVNSGIRFNEIFDYALPESGMCPDGYKLISKRDNNLGATCLMLKPGMEMAAAFLESRRYLVYLNGTAELTKFEGMTFDAVTFKLYGAMSQVRSSMEDNKVSGVNNTEWDFGGSNDIRVPYNPCGCVYAMDLTPDYVVTTFYGEVCGVPVTRGSLRNEGRCDQASLSEPDNVIVLPGQGQLVIGEDTGQNRIDMMWLYDLTDKSLTRIFSSNYGAETTSPYWFPNINGWSYLGAAVQHPYGESDEERITDSGSTGGNGWVGAWGFRSSDFANGEKLKLVAIPYPRTAADKHDVNAAAAGYRYMSSSAVVDMPMHVLTGQDQPAVPTAK